MIIKGEDEDMFKYCDTYITVKKDALIHNANYFKTKGQKKLIAVIKSNAYGHGLLEVANCLKEEADTFAVASLDSALTLRNAGINLPIIILNPLNSDYVELASLHNLMITISSFDYLKEVEGKLKNNNQKVRIQIKIDTGMNRMGLKTKEEYKKILDYIKGSTIFEAVGVYTHFHSADNENYSKQQVKRFKEIYETYSYDFEYVHICSSSAVLFNLDIAETSHVRVGIGLYGLVDDPNLVQVISLYSTIEIIKDVRVGEIVSYNANYKAHKETTVGVLPLGYSDGIIRKNVGRNTFVDGHYAEILGTVCMNSLMIELPSKDVTKEVELIGEHITVKEIAAYLDTITYEVTTVLPPHIKRIVI